MIDSWPLVMNSLFTQSRAICFTFCCCLLLVSQTLVIAQEPKSEIPNLYFIPVELRASLLDRIQLFIEAQRTERWDEVAALLGEFRGHSYRKPYTKEHKQCLIEQMKSSPMVSFHPAGAARSTEILSKPLSRKWWDIKGDAEFKTATGTTTRRETIRAYRFKGEWYLTPSSYDDAWARAKLSEEDLSAELNRYYKLEVHPDCPLEILDLSVRIDPQYLSQRQVSFKVRNKSTKTVDGMGFRLEWIDGRGSLSSGAWINIGPGETVAGPDRISSSGYMYYCEGEAYHRLLVDHVSFTDGTEWSLHRQRATSRRSR